MAFRTLFDVDLLSEVFSCCAACAADCWASILCHLLFNAKDNGKWKMGPALRLMDGRLEDSGRPNDDVEIEG